jgi:hypothetical protein
LRIRHRRQRHPSRRARSAASGNQPHRLALAQPSEPEHFLSVDNAKLRTHAQQEKGATLLMNRPPDGDPFEIGNTTAEEYADQLREQADRGRDAQVVPVLSEDDAFVVAELLGRYAKTDPNDR